MPCRLRSRTEAAPSLCCTECACTVTIIASGLKGQLERGLLEPRSNGADAGDLSDVSARNIRVRVGEVGVVEGVEGFPAKLQVAALADEKVLNEAEIAAVDAGPLEEVRGVLPKVPPRLATKSDGLKYCARNCFLPPLWTPKSAPGP